ncbi:iron-sulfur protein [Natronomonas pharaonis DSM 2160]|uniref:Iron-sulfur protein n=1 Tax=Natronomonas pharaonis (strain ATCC 35678 / DSM 2160 / CIP 103997 / JCM 8858 / NBRC 14720 / NCIMB 2260 / Gabara) TaxID=348780 RepID=A0A1U7EZ78_NATPD|nr:hydrogenase iron-sulfur subunit [Natronomonas pharaonis]CAI50576.2 iron-sulfur protein [Natronomonas pharaonis DSM 2160]
MSTGAFLCSCADTCDIDLEAAREDVEDVDVAASSSLLCQDKIGAFEHVIDEYDLSELLVTCPEPKMQEKLRGVAEEHGVHPAEIEFVDQREGAGWVHDEPTATDKTARLLNAANAGRQETPMPRSSIHQAGDEVVVVGAPEVAAAIAGPATVTLFANGAELTDVDADLDDVSVERGRVVDVSGTYGDFEVTVRSRVTDDCISCMKCVHEGPDGKVTRRPVDIAPDAEGGEWVDVCPTDAIEMDGVERTVECDQIVYPDGDSGTVGGQRGFHTAPIDSLTIDTVERLLGGFESPDYLDLEMDICASGNHGEMGCNACVDACPHGAVERTAIDEVGFHRDSCQDCGACTSACPTGATMLREPSNERIAREVEALLTPGDDGGLVSGLLGGDSPGIDSPIVAFVCSERAEAALSEYGRRAAAGTDDIEYPPILPVDVNCTDTVGEAHVLHALAAGADGVAIVGCGGHCLHSGPDPKAELVDRLNTATTDLGLGERVAFFSPDPDDPGAFVEALSQFAVVGLDESPVPAGDHEATGRIDDPDRDAPAFDTHAWALESVRTILEHVDPDRDHIRGLETFGVVDVAEGCTLTPTCSRFCPTDALRRTGSGLEFNHERCVNCGLCADVCVEDVITVDAGLDLGLLPEQQTGPDPAWTLVAEGEMQTCAGCGREYTSEATAEAIEERIGDVVADLAPEAEESIIHYCPQCRTELLHSGS